MRIDKPSFRFALLLSMSLVIFWGILANLIIPSSGTPWYFRVFVFPLTDVLISLVSILLPFSLLYLAVNYSLFFFLKKLFQRLRQPEQRAALVIALVNIGNWLSLFFSRKETGALLNMNGQDINSVVAATGGFPLKIFLYPLPPLGNDMPPFSRWPIFYLNYVIWFFIALLLVYILPKRFVENKKFVIVVSCVGILVCLLGLGYTLIQFD